ncbi:MAG: hypothetical protein JWM90_2618 [Thermoleophilia bacterium]|nr:hypothetical protein [Thermoleophilia bacterium]
MPPAILTPRHATAAAPAFVDAAWLAANLEAVRVIDTRRGADYLDAHVPSASSFALDALLVEDTSHAALHRLARAAQAALAARGIAPDDHVVLTDDSDGSAALGALVCRLAGMTRISVLLGGISSWRRSGHGVAHAPSDLRAVAAEAWADVETRFTHVATFEQLEHAVRTSTAHVIDVRSQLEHDGIIGSPCCRSRGAIPESMHVEWTAFVDMAGLPHGIERVRAIGEHLGLGRDEAIILSCHAGHRAAVAAGILRSAGFSNVRVSLGSWHEWSARAAERAR